jgi:biotin synthase
MIDAAKTSFDKREIIRILSARDPAEIERFRQAAEQVLLDQCGSTVYFRGLIEFSNVCAGNCLYCGIRAGNAKLRRYTLTNEEIVDAALWCAGQGFGSVVLQSGERRDPPFIDFVENTVRDIKERSRSPKMPDGLGITLSVGEQRPDTYARWFRAGAHRYLLRIETSSRALFEIIHPPEQSFASRVNCLRALKEIGYQLGTGVMIGLPGQTVEDLADDILFFREIDADMIGMGPYIIHRDTPMRTFREEIACRKSDIFRQSLLMIAATRLGLKDVNIASTTALQAMQPDGREQGLRFGANVVMPLVTPGRVRKDYLLYDGKPCIDESEKTCAGCLRGRIASIGREAGSFAWGDSVHAAKRPAQADSRSS